MSRRIVLPHPVMADSLRSVQDNFDALALYLNSAASASVGDWQTPTYSAPWEDYASAPARYRSASSGEVLIEGICTNTATFSFPTTICTLASGYRPPHNRMFTVPFYNPGTSKWTWGLVYVNADGTVQGYTAGSASGTAGSYFHFDGILFVAA